MKAEKIEGPLASPFPPWYALPQGRNEFDALKDYTKKQLAAVAAEQEAFSFAVYDALTLPFLSIGAGGWIFILIGKRNGDNIDP
jgi:hypothetical protein